MPENVSRDKLCVYAQIAHPLDILYSVYDISFNFFCMSVLVL